jgi:hypothetical protein
MMGLDECQHDKYIITSGTSYCILWIKLEMSNEMALLEFF